MIEPATFAALWQGELIKLPPASSGVAGVPPGAVRFLTEAGLPDSCAPFLSFDHLARGLRSISGIYFMPGESEEQGIGRLSTYLVIGHDGAGSPICLNVADGGGVVLADHEDHFRSVAFVNSGVPELAECLLAYRRLVAQAQAQNGEDALLDGDIPEGVRQEASLAIRRADPPAWEAGTFWRQEMDSLEWQ